MKKILKHECIVCQEKKSPKSKLPKNYYSLNSQFLEECSEFVQNIIQLEDSPWSKKDIVQWIREDLKQRIGQTEIKILRFLQQEYFLKNMPCFCKLTYISERLNVHVHSVDRAIKNLDEKGFIIKIQWLYKTRRKNNMILPQIPFLVEFFQNQNIPDNEFNAIYQKFYKIFPKIKAVKKAHAKCGVIQDKSACKNLKSLQKDAENDVYFLQHRTLHRNLLKSHIKKLSIISYTNILYINNVINHNKVNINYIPVHKTEVISKLIATLGNDPKVARESNSFNQKTNLNIETITIEDQVIYLNNNVDFENRLPNSNQNHIDSHKGLVRNVDGKLNQNQKGLVKTNEVKINQNQKGLVRNVDGKLNQNQKGLVRINEVELNHSHIDSHKGLVNNILVDNDKEGTMLDKFLLKHKESKPHNQQDSFDMLKENNYDFDKLPVYNQNRLNDYISCFFGIDMKVHFRISKKPDSKKPYVEQSVGIRRCLIRLIVNNNKIEWDYADKVIEYWNKLPNQSGRRQNLRLSRKDSKAYINAVIVISDCLVNGTKRNLNAMFRAMDRLLIAEPRKKPPFSWMNRITIDKFFIYSENSIMLKAYLGNDVDFGRFVYAKKICKKNIERVKVGYEKFTELYINQFYINNKEKGKEVCYKYEPMIKRWMEEKIEEIINTQHKSKKFKRQLHNYSLIVDRHNEYDNTPPLLQRFFYYINREFHGTLPFVEMFLDKVWNEFIERHMRIEVGLTDFWEVIPNKKNGNGNGNGKGNGKGGYKLNHVIKTDENGRRTGILGTAGLEKN